MSEETSTSTSAAIEASSKDAFQLPTTMDFGYCPSDFTSRVTQTFHFSSGNPRIEETRGVMHIYRNNVSSIPSDLPVDRRPSLCVLSVPNHMTYADFCRFCGSFVHHMLEMRIIRIDGMEDRYSVLIRFDDQNAADSFYQHSNGRCFSSLEVETCHVLFVVDIQYIGSIEHLKTSPTCSTEQPSCPVCLEKLDQDTNGVLTTICNHSFHSSCISKWTDSSCPVCRYCQQQPEKSLCFICQTSQNLWMCVICGFIGCGRLEGGHAIRHWKDTEHCYSLELETQRVWDYAGDNYVHRLIQSKTDGKLVELNHHCVQADDGCGLCDCGSESGVSEAVLNSKVEAIVNEYNELLTTQLENQKLYFESLLQEVEAETEKETAEAIGKALSLNPKLMKLQAKLDKCIKEKKFLVDINENLLRNKGLWEAKIAEIEERERKDLKLKDKKIEELEKQLMALMTCLDSGTATEPSTPTLTPTPKSTPTNEAAANNVLPQIESLSLKKSTKGVTKSTSNRKSSKG